MARLVYAAQQLIDQIVELYPDVVVTSVQEPDGFDALRKIRFELPQTEELGNLIASLDDQRISGLHTDKDSLTVEFVSTIKADSKTAYLLSEAQLVAQHKEEHDVEAEAEDQKPAKKASAKSAQSKTEKQDQSPKL